MSKQRTFIKDKTGKFAGSIPGAQKAPTAALTPHETDPTNPDTPQVDTTQDVFNKFEQIVKQEEKQLGLPEEDRPEVFTKKYDSAKERSQAYMAEIEKGIEDFQHPECWTDYLETVGKFHKYSINNQMLIAAQTGGKATLVAGYQSWKKDFGRQVRKGEKGIAILVPMSYKKEEKILNTSTGKEDTRETKGIYFGVKPVFDISQTEGDPLPSPYETISETPPEGFREDLENVITKEGYTVEYQDLADPGYGGYTSKSDKKVVINSSNGDAEQVKTLAHELSHIKLGHMEKTREYHTGAGGSRPEMEVEAESLAYVLCRENGMSSDIGKSSFAYLKSWGGKESDMLRKTATNVSTGAKSLFGDYTWKNKQTL